MANIRPSTFASRRVKFFGGDARLPIVFFVIWLLYKAWITFFVFIAFWVFSIILEYTNIDFVNFIKKVRMMLTGSERKKVKKNY